MVKLRQVLTHTAADRNNTVRQPKGNGATPPPPAAGGGARRGDGAAGTEHRIPASPPRLDDARSAKCSARAPVPPWTTHRQTNQREWSNPHPTAARAGARHGDGAAKTTIASPRRRRVSTTRDPPNIPRGRPSHRGRSSNRRTKGNGATPIPPRQERAHGAGTARPRRPSHPRVATTSQRRANRQIFRAVGEEITSP